MWCPAFQLSTGARHPTVPSRGLIRITSHALSLSLPLDFFHLFITCVAGSVIFIYFSSISSHLQTSINYSHVRMSINVLFFWLLILLLLFFRLFSPRARASSLFVSMSPVLRHTNNRPVLFISV